MTGTATAESLTNTSLETVELGLSGTDLHSLMLLSKCLELLEHSMSCLIVERPFRD
jgi:hypothetical protein